MKCFDGNGARKVADRLDHRRAYGLLSQNLPGGSVPGDNYMGSLGNWYSYTAVLPEAVTIFEPSEINIVVAGGETQGAWKMIGGSVRARVSIDAWR
jgi:hypothetical protein